MVGVAARFVTYGQALGTPNLTGRHGPRAGASRPTRHPLVTRAAQSGADADDYERFWWAWVAGRIWLGFAHSGITISPPTSTRPALSAER